MKRFLSVIIALTLVVAMLAACAGNPSAPSSSVPDASGGDNTPVAQDATFTFLHYHNPAENQGTAAAYSLAAEKFELENPSIKVVKEFVAHDDYESNLKVLMAGDSLPDVFLAKGDVISQLADANVIIPLEDEVKADSDWYNGFVEGADYDGSYNGHWYALPFQMQSNTVITYNSEILKEVGYDSFPTVHDDWVTLIGKLKDAGYTPIALGNVARWVAESCLFNTFSYRFVTGEWFESLKNNQGAKFTDDAFVQSLTKFQELAQIGAFNQDMNSIDNMEQKTLYYNKKAAMFIEGAWSLGDLIANAPQDVKNATEFANMPEVVGAGGDKDTVAGGAGWGYCVNAKLTGENKAAALSFIKAITDSDYAGYAASMSFVAASKTTSVDEAGLDPLFAKYLKVAETMKFAPIYDVALPSAVGEELYAKTQELLIGSVTPQQMAEECQRVLEANY